MSGRPVPGSVQDVDDRAVQAFCAAVLGLKIDGVTLSTMVLSQSVRVTAWAGGGWKWSQDFWIGELRIFDPVDMAKFGVYRPVRQAIAERVEG